MPTYSCSCRAFFRRAHQATKTPNFSCKNNGACKVTAKTRYVSAGSEIKPGRTWSLARVTLDCRRKCQKCRYDLCLSSGMDPEMVLNADQKQFRFRNCLKKKMLKELEQQQNQDRIGSPEPQSGRPEAADSPPSPFPPPPPMVPIVRHYDDGMITSYGTTIMSAFSKPPLPVLVPSAVATAAPKPDVTRSSYEMPTQDRRPEYFSERRDERDVKIADVQLSYSLALDEVQTHNAEHIEMGIVAVSALHIHVYCILLLCTAHLYSFVDSTKGH